MRILAPLMLLLASSSLMFAGDNKAEYQMGTFVSVERVKDGTLTSTLRGDGTTVAGDVYENALAVYQVRVPSGTWKLVTLNQSQDSMLRNMGMTPTHFKSEKANPLDALKPGDKVLFRLHERRYLNGKFMHAYIAFADNSKKEVEFTATFVPDIAPTTPQLPMAVRSNVQAMCESGKLTPEQKS